MRASIFFLGMFILLFVHNNKLIAQKTVSFIDCWYNQNAKHHSLIQGYMMSLKNEKKWVSLGLDSVSNDSTVFYKEKPADILYPILKYHFKTPSCDSDLVMFISLVSTFCSRDILSQIYDQLIHDYFVLNYEKIYNYSRLLEVLHIFYFKVKDSDRL